MATTVDKSSPEVGRDGAADESQAETVIALPARNRAAGLMLLVVVFMAGASVMTVEMTASRLLAPYFGTSLFIWANLIGLVMVYLTVGYWLGGKIADRYPRASVLYGITGVAAVAVGLIPLLSRPILSWSLTGFAEYSVGIFYGSLIGVIALFSVPLLLLGFVSPFAIRLRSLDVARAGGTAGAVSALSTLGSILGTFVPVFLLIPYIGSAATLYTTAAVLLLFSVIGLVVAQAIRPAVVYTALLIVILGIAFFAPRGIIKPPQIGQLVEERESAYNYIQVVKQGTRVSLMLNEGHAVHSIYDPNQLLTGGPWDYWAVAPYFSPGFRPSDMKSMLMIGSAAGTAARIVTGIYGPVPVDGVEIDPEIVDIGKRYFDLGSMPNVVTHEEDGRTYLQTDGRNGRWTVIGIDAYRQPYIPFHLTTKEFFQEIKDHLTPDGAVMINAGRTSDDTRLVDALANTMLSVYPNVYVIDVPTLANSMVVGTNQPTRLEDFAQNAKGITQPQLKEIFDRSLTQGNIREVKFNPKGYVFTDDRAPVEEVINQMILGVVGEVGK